MATHPHKRCPSLPMVPHLCAQLFWQPKPTGNLESQDKKAEVDSLSSHSYQLDNRYDVEYDISRDHQRHRVILLGTKLCHDIHSICLPY